MLVAVAIASDGPAHEARPHTSEPTGAHAEALVSGRAQTGLAWEGHGPEVMHGGSLSLERPLGAHVAAELTVAKLVGREVEEAPLEIVVLATTWVGPRVEPYVGVGPAAVVVSDHTLHATRVRPAVVAVAGMHLWPSRSWGMLVECGAMASWHDGWSTGLEAIAGPVVRWP